jgi:hypothetical protein
MPFEMFIPSKKKNAPKRSNVIGFSPKLNKLSIYRPIVEKYFQDKEFVYLYYDKDEKLIGIKAADKQDDNTIKLSGQKAKVLMIGRFLKQYGIELKEAIQFPIEDRNGMLVLKIS